MRLPFASNAIVERRKIDDYLLNLNHPIGASKARFFRRLGFTPEHPNDFARALIGHAEKNEVLSTLQSEFGFRYEVAGPIECPNGANAQIITVWQHDIGQVAPRLITAYPFNS